ncbi:MAG: diaminopimelate epimerase, partial [Pseudomonadota bacterium]|nr:diaminopimelate epimerase [Pseudomonadota bacterium]
IPLAEAVDSAHVTLADVPYSDACCVGVGNPHAVFFVADAEAVDLAGVGPGLETHPMFPARANIEFVHLIGSDHLRMRVWERAAGITQACGSGACASAVAAARRGLTGRVVTVDLDGGRLQITWRDDDHVIMAGPTALSFTGAIDLPDA